MKTFVGTIVSLPSPTTAVVKVTRIAVDPIYKKQVKKMKRLKTHAEGIAISVGDTVKIGETRPISKEKHFRILTVIKNI